MNNLAKHALSIAQNIQNEAPIRYVPPSEGTIPKNQAIIPHSMVRNTRGYIERIVYQINGSYEKGWFDACAVMMRRLLETLIIEVFEAYNIANKIQNSNGDFFYLADLINSTLNEPSWNLGRNTKRALPKLKSIGDQSAHSRRFNAHRENIDKILPDFRSVSQEFLYLANLK